MSVTLHTDLGTLKLEVYCDIVPRTSFNFLALAASGYYDNTLFHRNIKGFMLQGGDPTGTGKGGESIWGGKFNDEIHPDNKHTVRGVVSMANSGPNTNGSQFFITYAKHPHLDNNCAPPRPAAATCNAPKPSPAAFAPALVSAPVASAALPAPADSVFGKIIDGFDTLDALERCQVNDKHRPLSEIRLRSVTVHANPLAVRSSSPPTAAAVHLTHKGGPSRVAGPNDHLPVRQRGPGHPRVKGYGCQKGAEAARGAAVSERLWPSEVALRLVATAVAAPQPRRRLRTGARRSAIKANRWIVGALT